MQKEEKLSNWKRNELSSMTEQRMENDEAAADD